MNDSHMKHAEFLWSEDFWSHPNVLLFEHLYAVSEACKEFIINAGIKDQRLVRAAELLGKAHDFGKYTSYFQSYLRERRSKFHLTEHSPISALFSAWLVKRELGDEFLTLAAYISVLRHHGNLNKNLSDLINWLEDNFGDENRSMFSPARYQSQIKSILKNLNRISGEMKNLGIEGVERFIDELPETYSWLRKLFIKLEQTEIEDFWRKYFTLLLLFSALLDSDVRDATRFKKPKRLKLKHDLVDTYRKKEFKIPKKPLDPLRNKVYLSTVDFLKSSGGFFKAATITAPTGIGKTLLSLSIALKLREHIHRQTGTIPRIIYVLPYINITEQTYEIFLKVLKGITKGRVSLHLLLKHHHLYSIEEHKEKMSLEEAILLQEAWESEIIVTTFVQFFHTLVGGHKQFLKKFHNMYNSIVILDEVQTIPMEYWKLVKESIQEFVTNSNSSVIAMTATKPIIFNEWIELLPEYHEVYKRLDRVDYEYINKDIDVNEVANWFSLNIWNGKTLSALVVMNTISSSIKVYDSIKKSFLENKIVCLGEKDEKIKLKDKKRTIVAYLSTNIIPAEMKRRIKLIKKLIEEKRKVIVVSTQVIEAGVDLDFEIAVRDLGPIDSIVQVAGRCNRSGEKRGKVYIIRTVENGQKLAPKIYGNLSIWIAEQTLMKFMKFQEREILKIVDEYFNKTYERKSCEKSEEVLNALKKLDFSKISQFKLIEEEPKESVFIELNENARCALERFRRSLEKFQGTKKSRELEKIFKCKAELRKTRNELENWIVAVWDKNRNLLPSALLVDGHENIPIWHVRKSEVDKYYKMETGYILLPHAAIL